MQCAHTVHCSLIDIYILIWKNTYSTFIFTMYILNNKHSSPLKMACSFQINSHSPSPQWFWIANLPNDQHFQDNASPQWTWSNFLNGAMILKVSSSFALNEQELCYEDPEQYMVDSMQTPNYGKWFISTINHFLYYIWVNAEYFWTK